MQYLLVTGLLLITIIAYFKIAERFNIVDIPNHRSSHTLTTIRGAGIIFPVSVALAGIVFGGINILLIVSVIIISIVSFIDDIKPLPVLVRLPVHLLCVSLALYALNIYMVWPIWLILVAYIFVIGGINAFNFMDGINGITGIYALTVLATMLYVNTGIVFIDKALLISPLIACIIFLYFNFRKKASCFAGDAGSISIALWVIILLVMLINKTGNYKYIFLLSVYGADVIFTILKRISLKQNLLQAHRLHVYQLLVNNGGYSHRAIAVAYGAAQIMVNLFILFTQFNFMVYLTLIVLIMLPLYLFFSRLYSLQQTPITA